MQAIFLKFRKQILGGLVVLVLLFGARWYIHDVRDTAYNQGFEVANTAWKQKGQEYVGIINDQYRKNVDLNNQLKAEQSRKDEALRKLTDTLAKERLEYSKSPESKTQCLDPKFVNMYNTSLGDK